jgi:acyl-CoA synthetase (AMP-forming)/AMP-acid ligase II
VTQPFRGSTARPEGSPGPRGPDRPAIGEYAGTIPRLLAAAADRDSGGIWLRSDEGTLTFEGAVAAVGRTAAALAAGVRKGDLIMLTAATTPTYLLCWLAITSLGAVAVAVNPRSSGAELAGLIRQVRPRLLVTDAGLAGLVESARLSGLADGSRPAATTLRRSCLPTGTRPLRPHRRRCRMRLWGRMTWPC